MRLVCPYVPWQPGAYHLGQHNGLDERTREWVLNRGGELVDVSGGDQAYWQLLRDLWRAGESFVLVEEDILPTRRAYNSLRHCPRSDWCVCPYRVNGVTDGGLGFTRFSGALMRRHPDAIEGIPPDKRWWVVLDGNVVVSLVQRLRHPGPHIHRRYEVEHLHKYGR